jgi:cytochrome c-type protein NapB
MALAVTIGVSVAGFLIGVREQPTPERLTLITPSAAEQPAATPGEIPVVVGYAQMPTVRRGPNANWPTKIQPTTTNPTAFYSAASPTPEERAAALATRGEHRAFSGAPPVVPHAIDERNAQACLACHGSGLKVGSVVAPKMSHHLLTNCTQCHVESVQDFPGALAARPPAESVFVGLKEPGAGNRIGPGAPPVIPHALWMRSECAACHGELGRDGLRASHPWRSNCTQCHAPSRAFDWAPLEEPPPKPPREKLDPNSSVAGA